MTTTTSFSNGNRFLAVLKQDLRRIRSMMIFYWVLTTLFFPVQYLMETLNGYIDYNNNMRFHLYGPAEIYNTVSYLLFWPIMFAIPIVLAMMLVGYMQQKRAVDVYHALPVTRSQMMLSHFAAGMLAIGGPLLVNFLLVTVIQVATFGTRYLWATWLEFLFWMIIVFFLFATTAFAAVNVGTLFDSVLFTVALNCLVPFLYLAVVGLYSTFVYGFNSDFEWLIRLSPVILMITRQTITMDGLLSPDSQSTWLHEISCTWFPIWLLIAIALMAFTILFYRRRKSEQAESVDTTGLFKTIMKFAATFLGAVAFGIIIQGVFGEGFMYAAKGNILRNIYFVIGSMIGAVITYIFAELVLSRGFKTMKRNIIPCGIATLLMGAFAVGMVSGGFGYANRVPSPEEIEGINLTYTGLGMSNTRYECSYYDQRVNQDSTQLAGEEAKEIITQLHKAQIQEYEQAINAGKYPDDYVNGAVNITYQLKNGGTMRRQYYDNGKSVADCLLRLETCDEFIQKNNPVVGVTPDQIQEIELVDVLGEDHLSLDLSQEQTQQLLDAVKADLFAQTPEQLAQQQEPSKGHLVFYFRNYTTQWGLKYNSTVVQVESTFENTIRFLEELQLMEMLTNYDLSQYTRVGAILRPQNYFGSSGVVIQATPYMQSFESEFDLNNWSDVETSNYWYGNTYFTQDPEKIQQLFDLRRDTVTSCDPVIVLAFYKEENNLPSAYFYLSAEDAPADLLEQQAQWLQDWYPEYWEEIQPSYTQVVGTTSMALPVYGDMPVIG